MNGVAVYLLRDPRTSEIRYVGLSGNPVRRYTKHLNARGRTHRARWIRSLLRVGVIPVMDIACVCENLDRARLMEMKLIAGLRDAGHKLTNLTDGGETGSIH